MIDTSDEDLKGAVVVGLTLIAAALVLRASVTPHSPARAASLPHRPAKAAKGAAPRPAAPPASAQRYSGDYEGRFWIGAHSVFSRAGRAALRVSPAGVIAGYGYQPQPGSGSGKVYLWAGTVDGAGSVKLYCGRIGPGTKDGRATGPLQKAFTSDAGPVDTQCEFRGQILISGGRATLSLEGMDCDGATESVEAEREKPR